MPAVQVQRLLIRNNLTKIKKWLSLLLNHLVSTDIIICSIKSHVNHRFIIPLISKQAKKIHLWMTNDGLQKKNHIHLYSASMI